MTTLLKLLTVSMTIGWSVWFGNTQNQNASHNHENIVTDEAMCASDEVREALFEKYPEKQAIHESLEKQIYDYVSNNPPSENNPPIYTLPVVVHIVHQNGNENLPDLAVQQGIQHLNDAFENIGYYDQGTGVDVQISFCLATQDPEGLPTNGITRDFNPLTQMTLNDDIALKDVNRWNPTEYINIWLVREIDGAVAGYAFLPSSHGAPEDGIVMEAEYFGSSESNSTVIVHEMGHYLGLYHTFEGGCTNDNCLTDGDRVCDTPPDITTVAAPCEFTQNSCSTDVNLADPNNPFTDDQDDMFINYMDYSDWECYSAFTAGQRDRMQFFVETTRSSLLNSKGCEDPCFLPITADFVPDALEINIGNTLNFVNNSTNGLYYVWRVDGVTFSTAIDTAYQFDELGFYDITLVATNDAVNCIDSITQTIEVTCPAEASFIQDAFTVDVDEIVNFTNTSLNGITYEWFIDGVSQGNTTDFSTSFDSAGLYSVYLVANSFLCSDTSSLTNFIRVGDCSVSVNYTPAAPNTCDDIQFMADSECDHQSYYWSYCEPDSLGAPDILPAVGGIGSVPVGIDFVDNTQNGTGYHIFVTRYQQSVFRIQRIDYGDDINNPAPNVVNISTPAITGGGPQQLNQGIDIIKDNGEFIGFMVVWDKIFRLNFGTDITNTTPQVTEVGGITGAFVWGVSLDVYKIGANWWALVTARNSNNVSLLYFADDIRGDVQSYSSHDGGNANAEFTGATLVVEDEQFYVLACDINNGLIRMDFGGSLANAPTSTNLGYFGDGLHWAVMVYKECESSYVGFIFKEDHEYHQVIEFDNGITSTPVAIDSIEIDGRVNSVTPFHRIGDELNFFVVQWQDATVTNLRYKNCDSSIPASSTGQTPSVVYYGDAGTYNVKLIVDEGLPWQQVVCTTIDVDHCGVENCFNGRDDDGDGLVDCYDPDCCGSEFCEDFYFVDCNIDCEGESQSDEFEMELEWSTLGSAQGWHAFNTPIVVDLDRDGNQEIIGKIGFAGPYANRILIFSGENGDQETVFQAPSMRYFNDAVSVADLDGNGQPEMFYHAGNSNQNANYSGVVFNGDIRRKIVCYEYNGLAFVEKWVSDSILGYSQNEDAYPLNSADFDGDGIAEVYAGNQIFSGIDGTELVSAGADADKGVLEVPGTLEADNNAGGYSVAADLLPDAFCADCQGLELVAGGTVYSVNIDPLNPSNSTINIEVETDIDRDGRTSIADMDKDGDLDAVVTYNTLVNQNICGVYVWDIQTSSTIATSPSLGTGEGNLGQANIADFDGDGIPEIGLSTRHDFTVLKLNGAGGMNILWQNNVLDGSGQTGATVFDFNQDGIPEVVNRDALVLRIFDGTDGTMIFSDSCSSATGQEYPVVVDVDSDGETEMLCSCNDELRAYGSSTNPWVGTRSTWNQHNYFNVNINDDLSVPKSQQNHHIVKDSIVLNTFLTPYADPHYAAADATISVDDFGCGRDSFEVTITVCNEGDWRLSNEAPITFYDADPTTTNANVLTTKELGVNLDPDGCATITFYIPSLYDMPIFVVVNDDGTEDTPFDLGTDFPVTELSECNYLNNIQSFLLEGPPPPELDLGPDQLICDNAIIELNAGGDFVSYEWYNGKTDSIITVWQEGEYWVNVIDSCGQLQTDTIEIITDFPTVAMVTPQTATICPGQSVEFCVQEEFFQYYQWQDLESLSCTDCRCTVATPDEPGSYIVMAWTDSGCYSVDTVEVFFATINTNDEVLVCPGESAVIHGQTVDIPGNYTQTYTNWEGCDSISSVDLVNYLEMIIFPDVDGTCELATNGVVGANVINGTHPLSYEWNIPGAGDTSQVGNVSPGNYMVTVTDANGCTQSNTINVPVINPLSIDFEITNTCTGGNQGALTANVTGAQGAVTYEWDVAGAGNVNTVTGLTAGGYNLTITDALGCTLEQSVTVQTVDDPAISTVSTAPACPDGNDGLLSVINGNPGWMYSLDGDNYQSSETFPNLSPGNYTIFISDGPCNYEVDATVPNAQAPDVSTEATPPTCPDEQGDDGTITIINPDPSWTFRIDGGGTQTAPFFSGLSEGEHVITVIEGNCEYEVVQTVPNAPSVDVSIEAFPSEEGRVGDTIMLVATPNPSSLDVVFYDWTPSENVLCDNNNCDTAWVVLSLDNPLSYSVEITTSDECIARADQDLSIIFFCNEADIRFPNAFTPDGDTMNDFFELPVSPVSDAVLTSLDIYNRWGQLIYESGTDGDLFWDGLHDGKPAPSDVYVYVAKYVCGETEGSRFGEVTLLR